MYVLRYVSWVDLKRYMIELKSGSDSDAEVRRTVKPEEGSFRILVSIFEFIFKEPGQLFF